MKKGKEYAEYPVENMAANMVPAETAAGAVADLRWYEEDKIDVAKIPIAGRPRGKGVRIDFFGEAQFPDMALEIKEAAPKGRFKNTNDVHRAAHYIGMYMLRRKVGSVPVSGICKMYYELENSNIEAADKLRMLEVFTHSLELFCSGLITDAVFEQRKQTIIGAVKSEEAKAWAIETFMELTTRDTMYDKMISNIRVKKNRSKKAALGLRVVDGAEAE